MTDPEAERAFAALADIPVCSECGRAFEYEDRYLWPDSMFFENFHYCRPCGEKEMSELRQMLGVT